MEQCELTIEALLNDLTNTKGASDLIITAGKPPQLRIYNELHDMDYPFLTSNDTEKLCMSMLTKEQAEELKDDLELDLSYSVHDVGRFRVNMYKQKSYFATVARVIYDVIPEFKELNLPEIILKFAMLPRGLVLITGPIGTGKSTTISSMIDYINRHRCCHIVTVEDPIEYVHTHDRSIIDQREVGADTRSFHNALRTVLRQSTDVVVIGEIRDRESAQAAITLAETGHLTLATLHTRGVVPTISRLIDMFPQDQHYQIRSQLSASLVAVVWQQLLPKKDKKGLIPTCEIMSVTPAIRSLIRQGRLHEIYSAIQTGQKIGMCTMEQYVQQLMQEDKLDHEWLRDNFEDFNTAKGG